MSNAKPPPRDPALAAPPGPLTLFYGMVRTPSSPEVNELEAMRLLRARAPRQLDVSMAEALHVFKGPPSPASTATHSRPGSAAAQRFARPRSAAAGPTRPLSAMSHGSYGSASSLPASHAPGAAYVPSLAERRGRALSITDVLAGGSLLEDAEAVVDEEEAAPEEAPAASPPPARPGTAPPKRAAGPRPANPQLASSAGAGKLLEAAARIAAGAPRTLTRVRSAPPARGARPASGGPQPAAARGGQHVAGSASAAVRQAAGAGLPRGSGAGELAAAMDRHAATSAADYRSLAYLEDVASMEVDDPTVLPAALAPGYLSAIVAPALSPHAPDVDRWLTAALEALLGEYGGRLPPGGDATLPAVSAERLLNVAAHQIAAQLAEADMPRAKLLARVWRGYAVLVEQLRALHHLALNVYGEELRRLSEQCAGLAAKNARLTAAFLGSAAPSPAKASARPEAAPRPEPLPPGSPPRAAVPPLPAAGAARAGEGPEGRTGRASSGPLSLRAESMTSGSGATGRETGRSEAAVAAVANEDPWEDVTGRRPEAAAKHAHGRPAKGPPPAPAKQGDPVFTGSLPIAAAAEEKFSDGIRAKGREQAAIDAQRAREAEIQARERERQQVQQPEIAYLAPDELARAMRKPYEEFFEERVKRADALEQAYRRMFADSLGVELELEIADIEGEFTVGVKTATKSASEMADAYRDASLALEEAKTLLLPARTREVELQVALGGGSLADLEAAARAAEAAPAEGEAGEGAGGRVSFAAPPPPPLPEEGLEGDGRASRPRRAIGRRPAGGEDGGSPASGKSAAITRARGTQTEGGAPRTVAVETDANLALQRLNAEIDKYEKEEGERARRKGEREAHVRSVQTQLTYIKKQLEERRRRAAEVEKKLQQQEARLQREAREGEAEIREADAELQRAEAALEAHLAGGAAWAPPPAPRPGRRRSSAAIAAAGNPRRPSVMALHQPPPDLAHMLGARGPSRAPAPAPPPAPAGDSSGGEASPAEAAAEAGPPPSARRAPSLAPSPLEVQAAFAAAAAAGGIVETATAAAGWAAEEAAAEGELQLPMPPPGSIPNSRPGSAAGSAHARPLSAGSSHARPPSAGSAHARPPSAGSSAAAARPGSAGSAAPAPPQAGPASPLPASGSFAASLARSSSSASAAAAAAAAARPSSAGSVAATARPGSAGSYVAAVPWAADALAAPALAATAPGTPSTAALLADIDPVPLPRPQSPPAAAAGAAPSPAHASPAASARPSSAQLQPPSRPRSAQSVASSGGYEAPEPAPPPPPPQPAAGPPPGGLPGEGAAPARLMPKRSTVKLVTQVFHEKIAADMIDDADGEPRADLWTFLWQFFLTKFGVPEAAQAKLSSLVRSVRHWIGPAPGGGARAARLSAARLRVFARFLGIGQAEGEVTAPLPGEALDTYLGGLLALQASGVGPVLPEDADGNAFVALPRARDVLRTQLGSFAGPDAVARCLADRVATRAVHDPRLGAPKVLADEVLEALLAAAPEERAARRRRLAILFDATDLDGDGRATAEDLEAAVAAVAEAAAALDAPGPDAGASPARPPSRGGAYAEAGAAGGGGGAFLFAPGPARLPGGGPSAAPSPAPSARSTRTQSSPPHARAPAAAGHGPVPASAVLAEARRLVAEAGGAEAAAPDERVGRAAFVAAAERTAAFVSSERACLEAVRRLLGRRLAAGEALVLARCAALESGAAVEEQEREARGPLPPRVDRAKAAAAAAGRLERRLESAQKDVLRGPTPATPVAAELLVSRVAGLFAAVSADF